MFPANSLKVVSSDWDTHNAFNLGSFWHRVKLVMRRENHPCMMMTFSCLQDLSRSLFSRRIEQIWFKSDFIRKQAKQNLSRSESLQWVYVFSRKWIATGILVWFPMILSLWIIDYSPRFGFNCLNVARYQHSTLFDLPAGFIYYQESNGFGTKRVQLSGWGDKV